MIEEIGKQRKNVQSVLLAGDGILDEGIFGGAHDENAMEFDPVEVDSMRENYWKYVNDIKYLFEYMPEAFWKLDKNLNFIFTNDAFRKICGGFEKEEIIGRSLLEFLTPEGIEHLWRVNGSRLKEEDQGIKTDFVFYELQIKRKDGMCFWAGISSSPFRDSSGEVIGYQGIMRDISVYKQYEMEHKRNQDLLKKAEKMAAVGKVAGGVAQELNNVMAGILGYSELLLLQQDGLDDNAFHRHIRNIINSGEKAVALIQDLLVISRKDTISRKPVNLNELIPACLKKNEFQKLSERYPGIAIYLDLEPSLHYVRGVLPQLDKSIMNLLAVSCEQARQGGAVSIATRTVYLGRPINGYDNLREGEYVVLSITDTGEGIADEDVGHIFEPFYIRNNMRKGVTGLELSVVREVVKDHNGFIDVKSKVGCGSTFTVYLPVSHENVQGNCYMM